jgi:hypothetical protein
MGWSKTKSHGISSFSYQMTIEIHHIPWLPIILPHKNHNFHRFYQLPFQVPNLKIYCTLQSHRGYHSSYIDLDHIYIYELIYIYICILMYIYILIIYPAGVDVRPKSHWRLLRLWFVSDLLKIVLGFT